MSLNINTPAQALMWGLAGLCGLLLLMLGAQRLFGGGSVDDEVMRVAPNKGPGVGDLKTGGFELPPLAEYRAIVQRPLFNETRRPMQEEAGPSEAQQRLAQARKSELPPVTLTGVIITPQGRFAMMHNAKNNRFYALKEGTPLEGWVVETIGPRRVVFTSESGEEVVELDVYTGGGGGGARAAAPAARDQTQSAAELIRQRIQRERERRRALIEAARKQQGDG